MMSTKKVMTIGERDVEIRKHSLHLKHDSQLFFVEEMLEAKIPRVNRDLMEILFFPDAKRKEICENYIQSGEVTNYFDLETPVPISIKDREKIDDEYQHEVDFYTTKVSWLKDKLTCCQKEMELRADGLVVREPKGTTYYVDFDNGHDVDNDGSSPVKTNGDGPWATLDKFAGTLVAGDIGIVRRGMTQAVSQDLVFSANGTIVAPITIMADYSDTWGDDTVARETATFTFGSKIVTFANDISGDIAAGDWIYEDTENPADWAYEVASVSGGSSEIVTLYLPYKGAISGAGKTVNIMPPNPIWNTVLGDFECNMDGDHFWRFQGLHIRGTAGEGNFEFDGASMHHFKDMIFEGNGGSDVALYVRDGAAVVIVRKTRVYNEVGVASLLACAWFLTLYDIFFDCNNNAEGIKIAEQHWIEGYDIEFVNTTSDIEVSGFPPYCARFHLRNCIFTAALIDNHSSQPGGFVYCEDFDGAIGDSRQFSVYADADDTAGIRSDAVDVRPAGGATSIKVTPSAKLDTDWEFSKIQIFEYAVYAVKDVAKTYTAYFKSDDATDWDANPLNTELWIEAEFWGHAVNVHRKVLKSTEVCNNFDADDTVWDTLTVTVTPLQTGVLYLRGYYCKTKEATNLNIFYCDTVIGVA